MGLDRSRQDEWGRTWLADSELRHLRNVIAHPAKMPVTTGESSADEFCFRMEREPACAAIGYRAPAIQTVFRFTNSRMPAVASSRP